jgi:predicted TIM-barrel enzyme
MIFTELFTTGKPLTACVHLMPLPGFPHYSGSMLKVYDTAVAIATATGAHFIGKRRKTSSL